MSNKTEQLNLRISTGLKSKLLEISDKKGTSMSDFIRQTLKDTIIDKDKFENRITTLEEKFNTVDQKLIRRMLYAGAHIASIDTGFPLDQCLTVTLQTLEEFGLLKIDMIQLSRAEMETMYINIQEKIKERLKLSDQAIAFISVLFAAFSGIFYDEHIFDMSPMSVKTLERLREVLK